jgi:hypothetical protein
MTTHTIKFGTPGGTEVYLECDTRDVRFQDIISTMNRTCHDGTRDATTKPKKGTRITIPEVYSTLATLTPHPNLILDSDDFLGGWWGYNTVTITPTPEIYTGYEGSPASRLVGVTNGAVYGGMAITPSNNPYTFSLFAQKAGICTDPTLIALVMVNGTQVFEYLMFDWNTLTPNYLFTGDQSRVKVELYPGGWYRLSVSKNNNGTNDYIAWYVYVGWNAITTGAADIYAFGGQLDLATSRQPYFHKTYGQTTLPPTFSDNGSTTVWTTLKAMIGLPKTLTIFGEVFPNTYIERLVPNRRSNNDVPYEISFVQETFGT